LVQREIERQGIPTIGISIVRSYTEKIRPPRSIFLHWPFGHPLGEPYNIAQQMTVLEHAFDALYSIIKPGQINNIYLKWKQESYTFPIWARNLHSDKAA